MAKDFLVEIGSEELPSKLLKSIVPQFETGITGALDKLGLEHGVAETYSSPRRIAVVVKDVAEKTPEVHTTRRGPKVEAAYDASGKPTQAAIGFAKSAGVSPDELEKKEEDGAVYIFAHIDKPSVSARDLLPQAIEDVLASLKWPKSQRWGAENVLYGRPVRWIVALLGTEILEVRFGDVVASNISRGHRVLGSSAVRIDEPATYKEALEKNAVLLRQARESSIKEQVKAIENEQHVVVDMPVQVFEEVVDLCEWPLALVGHFDEAFLQVPHEIICESMLSHQRYFPVYKDGELTTAFVVVANGDKAYAQEMIAGNERVVRARLDDAKFFFETDVNVPLQERLPKLDEVVFQSKLGSLLDKTKRLEHLAPLVVEEDNGTQEEVELATRAAQLSKCDLVSQTVIEFTSQQGVMGGYFATAQGENPQVAQAIAQQYKPRFAADDLPDTKIGRALAIADKLDTLAGMFAIGEPPTGSSDPFALRRGAIGIIRMLEEEDAISLADLINCALDQYADQGLTFDRADAYAEIANFFATRLETMAKDEGISAHVIKAILNTGVINPRIFFERVRALQDAKDKDPQLYEDLATAYARAHNLLAKSAGDTNVAGDAGSKCDTPVMPSSVNETVLSDAEKHLYDACISAQETLTKQLAANDFAEALNTLAALREPIDTFFEQVMVMDKDEKLRTNRLALLALFLTLFANVADISALAG